MDHTPGSSRCVLNFTDKMPSGTRISASSDEILKEDATRCLSFRLSELRNGAEVFRSLRGFLNMVEGRDEAKVFNKSNQIQISSSGISFLTLPHPT